MRARPRFAALAFAALLAACAPDAFIPSKPYDAFLGRLAKSCRGQAIGPYTVDQLARNTQSKHGNYFMDQTSRLYHGAISAQDWTTQVTGFLHGWAKDPGVACVIRDYNETREWTTPPRERTAPGSY
ncbi:MAG: hypothetical protein R3357_00985 [Burkholderiales bacterium]|nr:hypothetical protein [Burkholderiales bacterium]